MRVYFYQRKDATGKKAKEWSYRLPKPLRILPAQVWPDGFTLDGTLYTSKEATRAHIEAVIREAQHKAHLLRAGVPVVSSGPIDADIADYLEHGRSKLGKLDEGWSEDHAAHKSHYLKEWKARLSLATVADITFDAFDRELTRLKTAEGYANTTVNAWGHALSGLTKFCKERKRLAVDPLERWKQLKKVIRNPRGHYHPEEIVAIFQNAPTDDAITYQVAYYTRFREGELGDLIVGSIRWTHNLIELPPKYTKNGRIAFQPFPDYLAPILWEYCAGRAPEEPLLRIGRHPERPLYRLLDRLGIPRIRDGKKRDFHALGHSTATNMMSLGVHIAVIQKGMRHGSIRQALDYVAREALPVRAAVNSLAEQIYPHLTAQGGAELSHYFHTETNPMASKAAAAGTYSSSGESPSPSAIPHRKSRTHKNSRAQSGTAENGKNSNLLRLPRTGAHTSYPEARDLLAHLSHKLASQEFATLLREVVDLPADKIRQLTDLIRANRKAGAA